MPSKRVLTAVGFAARYPDCPAKGLMIEVSGRTRFKIQNGYSRDYVS